eukprot:13162684-Heterocapsa_arctica.AAC.1
MHRSTERRPLWRQIPTMGVAHPLGRPVRHSLVPRVCRFTRIPGSMELDAPRWAIGQRRA